ncbi:stage II sporulation protein M [Polymorphobacter sp. PAMC 29334]|uniref:stage II sporulation protein M n=1 Tax=Polymorphobacter sp. PAMC 29334 TaxID=2862331 RepID=UPI001C664CBD|nr:stage II sporulation protein M [Polymorphobacter sp. PAMC 29334]QYE34576.1 stage II sporulation protein M [Polymorphobacter sp. PAMC 29334]
MTGLVVGSRRFRADREADWSALEALLDRADKTSLRRLSDDDLLALPRLYRAAVSSLSVARATSLDADLVAYLEALSARAYFFVYGVRGGLAARAARFVLRDLPAAVRGLAVETLVALALLALGTVIGFILVNRDPAWYASFVPEALAHGRDPQATTASLRATLSGGGDQPLALLAGFLFTNNARVAIGAFALGFAAAVPTALLMLSTGTMLGAFFALFGGRGLGIELGGWLMIHGTTELFAVVLAGAAGLRIGGAVIFPGASTRIAAAQAAGRQAATVMIGVAAMLFVAGLLEGFARQLVTGTVARYAIAGAMFALWSGYFYLPRRTR